MIHPSTMIQTVYKVYTSTREGEKAEFCGVFGSFADAHKASTGKGGWTETGVVESAKGIVMDDVCFILEGPAPYYHTLNVDTQEKHIKEIEEAIAKLTDDEIERLNIDPERLKKLAKDVDYEEKEDRM